MAAKMITANDLLSGEVVYLSAAGQWSCCPDDALLLQDDTDGAARLADVQRTDISIVGPYLTAATRGTDGKTIVGHFREVFRTTGPSNRFLGKQAA